MQLANTANEGKSLPSLVWRKNAGTPLLSSGGSGISSLVGVCGRSGNLKLSVERARLLALDRGVAIKASRDLTFAPKPPRGDGGAEIELVSTAGEEGREEGRKGNVRDGMMNAFEGTHARGRMMTTLLIDQTLYRCRICVL